MNYALKKNIIILILFFTKSLVAEEDHLQLLSLWQLPQRKGSLTTERLGPCKMAFVQGEQPFLVITSFNENSVYTVPIDFDTLKDKIPDSRDRIRQKAIASPGIIKEKIGIYPLDLTSFPSDVAVFEDFVAVTQWGKNNVKIWKKSDTGVLSPWKELSTGISPESLLFTDTSLIVVNGFDASFSVFPMQNKNIASVGNYYSSHKISIDAVTLFGNKLLVSGLEVGDLSLLKPTSILQNPIKVFPPRIGAWRKSLSSFSIKGSTLTQDPQAKEQSFLNDFTRDISKEEDNRTSDLLTIKDAVISCIFPLSFRENPWIAKWSNQSNGLRAALAMAFPFAYKKDWRNIKKDAYVSHIPIKKLSSNVAQNRYFGLFYGDEIAIYDGGAVTPFQNNLMVRDKTGSAAPSFIDSVLFSEPSKEGKVSVFVLSSNENGLSYLSIYEMPRPFPLK